MRLHLNKKLRAALIAAISTVGTTLPQAQALTDLMTKDGAFTEVSPGHYSQTKDLTWDAIGDEVFANVQSLDMGSYSITLKLSQGKTVNQKYDVISGSGTYSYTRNHGGTGNRNTVWIGTASNFSGTLSVVSTQSSNNIMFGLGTSTKTNVADFSQAKVQAEHGVLALASNDVRVKELVTSTIDLRYTAGGVSQNAGTGTGVPMDEGTTQNKGTASDRGQLTVGKLTMSGTTVGNYIDFNLTGAGSTISGSTFGTGDTITVGEGADVTFSGAITLTRTIANSGAVTFSGATVTMNCGLADLAGTNNYSAGNNGYIVSANKYIVQGGTISGLTSVTIGGTTYDVKEDGAVEISNPDYTRYYLNTAEASMNVTDEKAEHQDLNNIVVNGANDVIQVGSDVSLSTIAVAGAASVSLSGSGSLAVTSELAIADGGSLTVGAGSALKLGVANAGELLKTVQGAGDIHIAADTLFAGSSAQGTPATTRATGALVVDEGKTLQIGTTDTGAYKHTYVDMTSFNEIRLDGSTLWIHNDEFDLKNVTVTEKGGTVTIHDTTGQNNNTLNLKGTTQLNGTLTFNGTWKQKFTIDKLDGTGTLKLAGTDYDKQIVNIGGGSAGKLQIGKSNVEANITGNLTLGGLTGTEGTVNAAKDLTFDVAENGEYSYTGTLTVGGQVVKTGAGTQTLGGFAINKAIDVQAGTLVLNGTYDITGIGMDPGVTYSYKNEHGEDSPDSVGGFRATSGSKTVYTKDASAIVTDGAATYKLDGKDVQLTDGKYIFSPEADLTELWVNGGTLSYDAYYAASGETPALTTAKVAGGATLAIGEHAVGTLEYQTNGSTIGLSGTGRVNAISGTGTLNLESGAVVTLGYAPTVASGQTFTTTGMGELVAEYIASTGGTVTIGSRLHLTKANDRTKGLSITNANGSIAINDDAAIDGSMYVSAGSVTIGGGRVEVGRIEFGDVGSAAASELTVNAGATLHVKGGDVSANYHSTGLLLGEWEGVSTVNVHGNLYADLATAQVGDKQANLNIENGGVMAVKGVGINDAGSGKSGKDQIINLNLKDGGKLVLGANGISSNKTLSAEFGHAEVGMTADTTLAKDITLTNAEGTTFNTTKYKWTGEGAQLTLGTDTVGGTMTVSGTLSGAGGLIVRGAGTLVLSGANTYSGGTAVNGGTLKAASDGALGTGDVTVNGATLQVASAGALGSGDLVVNGGTLELTTAVAAEGDITINEGMLKLAGADMLTADTLALGSGTVTFDLSKINVSHAGTITLATAATSASLGSATVQVVWEGLAPIFSHNGVQVSDNSWIITLTSSGQELYWNGGTANWDASAASWHTEAAPEEPVVFNSGDTAIFAADTTQAVANISGAIETGGVIVRDGADVVLQKALEAQEASINAPEIEISGALVSSVDMTATGIVGRGTAATWEIAEGSTVTTATLSAEEGATLTISGEGSLYAETVTGDGTIVFTGDIQPEYSKIVVAEGKELTLDGSVTRTISKDNLAIDGKLIIGEDYSLTIDGQYNPGTAGADLHIRNNGNLAVSLGNDQNVLRMDEQSAGNLEIKSGNISYLSELGNQTVTMDNGTQLWFGNNAGTKDAPDFTNAIVLNGDVTLRVYGSSMHDSVTISGDVSGEGHTLTKSDGNQNLTFTGVVNLGGLNTSNNGGGTIIFAGGEGSIGKISTPTSVTIRFSAKEGAANVYTFDTFAMSPSGSDTRWLIVDQGVTVHGTGSNLGDDHKATVMNSWGVNNGGLEVNGTLTTDGVIGMDAGNNTAYIKGTGTINTAGLNLCNYTTTHIQGGITINITSDTGIYKRNNNGSVQLKDATLKAVDVDWSIKDGGSGYTVALADATTGTTFNAAAERAITIANILSGSGKLVKEGEGSFTELKKSLLEGASWHRPDHHFLLKDYPAYKAARLSL